MDTRLWIKIVGIAWNSESKQKFCCIFQLFNRAMISSNSEPFLSLHVVLADSQLSLKHKRGGVGWEVTAKPVLATCAEGARDLCAG